MVNQEEMLAVLLAYSSTWQTLLDANTVDQALAQVCRGQAADGGDEPVKYPRAVVDEIERERNQKATRTFAGRGTLLLTIEAQPPDDTRASYDDQRSWFKEQIDAIELDMRTTSSGRTTPTGYSVSHFQIKTMSWAVDPFLVPEADQEEQETSEDADQRPLWAMQFRVEY
jgi:hypothetical protein